MKILHLTQFLGIGGLERVLSILMTEQMAAGHNVELVVYDYEQGWVEDFRRRGIIVDTSYRKKPGYDRALLRHLNARVRGYDVVHTHDLNPLMYMAPLKLLNALKRHPFPRLVHTAHGMDHIHQRPVTRLYERFSGKMTDATVAVSGPIRDIYIGRLGVSRRKVHQIDNGTPIPPPTGLTKQEAKAQAAARLGFDPHKITWVSVARVVPLKDQRLLVEAARRRPEINMVLVGPSGDQAYWDLLQTDKPDNAYMVGGQSDVNQILEGADYFVSASHHEGIPVSVLEAGAAGTPCLLSNIAGHATLQPATGAPALELFEPRDLENLLERMRELENDPGRSLTMAERLRSLVAAEYSAQGMNQKYLSLYTAAP